jgi:hypothetical protein
MLSRPCFQDVCKKLLKVVYSNYPIYQPINQIRNGFFFSYLTDFGYFPLNFFSTKVTGQSEHVKNGALERG